MAGQDEQHRLTVSRRNLGRANIGGPRGSFFGTVGRCSCRGWQYKVNEAPSKGGQQTVIHEHERHLAEVRDQRPMC